jgi:hypothetical protein
MQEKMQWKTWLRQAETEAFFQDLVGMRLELLEAWAAGDFTCASAEATVALGSKALGQVQMIDSILDFKLERSMEDD